MHFEETYYNFENAEEVSKNYVHKIKNIRKLISQVEKIIRIDDIIMFKRMMIVLVCRWIAFLMENRA
jgi:hypothetical protein